MNNSNLDLEHTQALKMDGGHLGNKKADTKICFQKLVNLVLKYDTDNTTTVLIIAR